MGLMPMRLSLVLASLFLWPDTIADGKYRDLWRSIRAWHLMMMKLMCFWTWFVRHWLWVWYVHFSLNSFVTMLTDMTVMPLQRFQFQHLPTVFLVNFHHDIMQGPSIIFFLSLPLSLFFSFFFFPVVFKSSHDYYHMFMAPASAASNNFFLQFLLLKISFLSGFMW